MACWTIATSATARPSPHAAQRRCAGHRAPTPTRAHQNNATSDVPSASTRPSRSGSTRQRPEGPSQRSRGASSRMRAIDDASAGDRPRRTAGGSETSCSGCDSETRDERESSSRGAANRARSLRRSASRRTDDEGNGRPAIGAAEGEERPAGEHRPGSRPRPEGGQTAASA